LCGEIWRNKAAGEVTGMQLKSIRSKLRVWAAAILIAGSSLWSLSAALGISSAQARPVAAGDVSIVDFAFVPAAITVSVGSAVNWLNTGAVTHTTTSDIGLWNSGDLGPGGSFSYTFDLPGVYLYHCAIHFGMTGTVTALTSVYLPLTAR
jgi:plastocyanin